jgi:glycosyltransferase involved in cell wall biosynthesis
LRILLVSLFLPQAKSYHAGGRYVYELLLSLSGRHEVHLATRLEEGELSLLGPLRSLCASVHSYTYKTTQERGLGDMVRLALNYMAFSRFADRLAAIGNYDIVLVEWTETGIFMKRRATAMVLDAHDVITKPAERRMRLARGAGKLRTAVMYRIIRAVERIIVKKFDAVFTRSSKDRDYLLSFVPEAHVTIVPHPAGLDITPGDYRPEPLSILFLASYKYRRTNVDAALYFYRSVLPIVKEQIPGLRFIIAGYGPPADLRSLADSDPSVSVPGFVEDIDACYKKAAVFVAPILVGGGIIVKILDAMAAGVPVVTTSFGNEGIEAVPGRDLLVADDAEDFAAAVVRVLKDSDLAARLSRNGREFVRRNFSRESVIGKVEAAFQGLSRGPAG